MQPIALEAIIVEPAHPRPQVPHPSPQVSPPRRGWSTATILLLVFGGGFVACCGLCGIGYYYAKGVDIYVDNDSAKTLTVYIDGEHVETVQPHTVKKVECKSGSKHVKVEDSAGSTVFDQQLSLKDQQYVLNPDKKHRYWIRKLTYRFALPKFALGKEKEPGENPQSFHEELQQLMEKIQIVPGDGPWFELPRKCDYMLGDEIPNEITGKGNDDVKYALLRIRPADVALLQQLQSLDGEPTPEQREKLNACLSRLKAVSDPNPKK